MPFGLCNKPGTFQRLMQRLFGDQKHQSLLLYLDDIIVYSSSVQHHLERLRMVLERLRAAELKVNVAKCAFFREKVRYLGHVISTQGMATDPGKVEVVAQWPCPKTVSELRIFLGFGSYYRRFVEGFAQIAASLHRLVTEVGKGKERTGRQELWALWSEKCEQAFRNLKQKLATTPVLAYADFKLPFILKIDASYVGLGAVQSQEIDGKRVLLLAGDGATSNDMELSLRTWRGVITGLEDYVCITIIELGTSRGRDPRFVVLWLIGLQCSQRRSFGVL